LWLQFVGLTPTDVFSTLQVYLGSQYVNDFNYLGRTYEVIAQADGSGARSKSPTRRLEECRLPNLTIKCPALTLAEIRGGSP
jgi:multidrug efflux pump subunit AcrB